MADGLFEIVEIRSTRTFGILCIARRRGDALGRNVAIKVLSGTLVDNPRVVTRARDEARLLSRLQHPNIVRVEELLSIQRRPVIVMEAIEGLSLRLRYALVHNWQGPGNDIHDIRVIVNYDFSLM